MSYQRFGLCAPFPIIYSSLSSGFFSPWFRQYDFFLFVVPMTERALVMVGITGNFGKLVTRGGVRMIELMRPR